MRCCPVFTVKSSTSMALFLVLDAVEHVALLASTLARMSIFSCTGNACFFLH